MSVNIFGSSKQVSGGPGKKGQPGIGFKLLDNEGNFNIDSKRLANVAQPISDSDAVTKVYVNEAISKQESISDLLKARIKRNGTRTRSLQKQISKDLDETKSEVDSLQKKISKDFEETKSEVDHLKSFCQIMDNAIAEIKKEYVTQQYFMNSMVENSKMLAELEKNNNRLYDQLNNHNKRVDELKLEVNTASNIAFGHDEILNVIQRRMDEIDETVKLNKMDTDSVRGELRTALGFFGSLHGHT